MQAETIRLIDPNIHEFPNQFFVAFKHDDLVCAGAAH